MSTASDNVSTDKIEAGPKYRKTKTPVSRIFCFDGVRLWAPSRAALTAPECIHLWLVVYILFKKSLRCKNPCLYKYSRRQKLGFVAVK